MNIWQKLKFVVAFELNWVARQRKKWLLWFINMASERLVRAPNPGHRIVKEPEQQFVPTTY